MKKEVIIKSLILLCCLSQSVLAQNTNSTSTNGNGQSCASMFSQSETAITRVISYGKHNVAIRNDKSFVTWIDDENKDRNEEIADFLSGENVNIISTGNGANYLAWNKSGESITWGWKEYTLSSQKFIQGKLKGKKIEKIYTNQRTFFVHIREGYDWILITLDNTDFSGGNLAEAVKYLPFDSEEFKKVLPLQNGFAILQHSGRLVFTRGVYSSDSKQPTVQEDPRQQYKTEVDYTDDVEDIFVDDNHLIAIKKDKSLFIWQPKILKAYYYKSKTDSLLREYDYTIHDPVYIELPPSVKNKLTGKTVEVFVKDANILIKQDSGATFTWIASELAEGTRVLRNVSINIPHSILNKLSKDVNSKSSSTSSSVRGNSIVCKFSDGFVFGWVAPELLLSVRNGRHNIADPYSFEFTRKIVKSNRGGFTALGNGVAFNWDTDVKSWSESEETIWNTIAKWTPGEGFMNLTERLKSGVVDIFANDNFTVALIEDETEDVIVTWGKEENIISRVEDFVLTKKSIAIKKTDINRSLTILGQKVLKYGELKNELVDASDKLESGILDIYSDGKNFLVKRIDGMYFLLEDKGEHLLYTPLFGEIIVEQPTE